MIYREEFDDSKIYKEKYLDGFKKILKNKEESANTLRKEYAADIFKNQEKYRNDLKEMLGWPLVGYEKKGIPKVEIQELAKEEDYYIYRMQFEILDGLVMSGLFFKTDDEKKPLVIVQHGKLGTPENLSGVYGSTYNYNYMIQRVLKQGVNAFAPQLLLWSDDYGVKYNREDIDARLKRVGSSVTAIEIFGICRILDYFEAQSYVSTLGMVGLSYGGFFTLYTTALDTRIKSAISCSFFNDRSKHLFTDWTWYKSAHMFNDEEIACLVYPRRLCIEIGKRDNLFDCENGIKAIDNLKKLCTDVGDDWLSIIIFDGTHEFCKDDEPIKILADDLKNKLI